MVEDKIREVLKEDADSWGGALNSAGWRYIESFGKHTDENMEHFNKVKPIVRDAILQYLDKVNLDSLLEETPMTVKSYTVAGYSLLLQATLNNKSLTSEQKFASIFESEIIEQIKEECLVPDINHEKYSNIGSLEALYEMLDTKRSYLEQLEKHN